MAVDCSLLPAKMRELKEEWKSSGSIEAFDFGSGIENATNITTDVVTSGGSLETRPDSFALDYQTAWAFGPIETGSIVSGSLTSSWRAENSYSTATQTGSILLSRENDDGSNWRASTVLFSYSGSALQEIDIGFDQAGRAVICADRIEMVNDVSQSLVWLYRFVGSQFEFSPIATGSTPRVLLDDTIDTNANDVIVFYIRSITSENFPELIFTTGSGISGSLTTSLCAGALSMSLSSYHKSDLNLTELGNFSSRRGLLPSLGITGTFNVGVSSVGATVVGPDFDTNRLRVYDVGDSLIDEMDFLKDVSTVEITKDTRIVSGNGTLIKSFRLEPGSGDYVGYDQIIIEPTTSCEQGTFSTQQVYKRIQRELYLTESVIPLVENIFTEVVSIIFGDFTGTIGSIDPEDAGMDGRLFGTSSGCPQGLIEGTISGSPCGIITPNVSQSILSGSFITPRTVFLAGTGTNNPAGVPNLFDGIPANEWNPNAAQAAGQRFIVNFQATESIGGFYMDIANDWIPGTLDVFSATASGSFVTRSTSISGSDPLVCMFTGAFDAVYVKVEMTSIKTGPTPAKWGIADLNFFDGITAFSIDGTLTGSHIGTAQGFVSGCITGTITHSGDLFGSPTESAPSTQSIIDGEEFLHELFLEDVVKLTDGRVALYVSRRNIDSGSNDFGEYRVNKFETILFPHQIIDDDTEDQWSASADLLFATLSPIIVHDPFDIESVISLSLSIPSGSSSLVDVIATHSVFDGGDIDSFVSYSCDILSGSFETL